MVKSKIFLCPRIAIVLLALSGVSTAVDIPLGGAKVDPPPDKGHKITVKNATGKDAYDISIAWVDAAGNPVHGKITTFESTGDTNNNKATKCAKMDTAVVGVPNNPVKYKVGDIKGKDEGDRRLADGQAIDVTITLDDIPAGSDRLEIWLSNEDGNSLTAQLFEVEPNGDTALALSLGEGDYAHANIANAGDEDYYTFRAVEDRATVRLTVSTTSTSTLLELLGTDGLSVFGADTGSMNLSVTDIVDYGTYYVRITNSAGPATYSLAQRITYELPAEEGPTLTQWGLIIMVLALLTAGAIMIARRSKAILA